MLSKCSSERKLRNGPGIEKDKSTRWINTFDEMLISVILKEGNSRTTDTVHAPLTVSPSACSSQMHSAVFLRKPEASSGFWSTISARAQDR